MERIELIGRYRLRVVAPSIRECLGQRGLVGEDVVPQALAERAHLAEAATLPVAALEGVSGATPFAERLGEDLGHLFPGTTRWTRSTVPPGERTQSIRTPLPPPCTRSTSVSRRWSRAPPRWLTGTRKDLLVDSRPAMAVLADLEQFLERLFERSSARVFGTRLQPVQLERRIERAMELGRVRRTRSHACARAPTRAHAPGRPARDGRRRPRRARGAPRGFGAPSRACPRLSPRGPAHGEPRGRPVRAARRRGGGCALRGPRRPSAVYERRRWGTPVDRGPGLGRCPGDGDRRCRGDGRGSARVRDERREPRVRGAADGSSRDAVGDPGRRSDAHPPLSQAHHLRAQGVAA